MSVFLSHLVFYSSSTIMKSKLFVSNLLILRDKDNDASFFLYYIQYYLGSRISEKFDAIRYFVLILQA